MRLPAFFCRLIGHKDIPVPFRVWRATGYNWVCIRCEKGQERMDGPWSKIDA